MRPNPPAPPLPRPSQDSPSNGRIAATVRPPLRVALWACLLLAGTVWLVHVLLFLWFPFQTEYGEGAVLGNCMMLRDGHLYRSPAPPPFKVCVYAPLHIALATWLMGPQPSLCSGRLLTAGSTLAVLIMLAGWLTRRANGPTALLGVVFFLLHPLVLGWSVYNRIDFLALAFTALALVTLPESDRGWRADLPAALSLGLAFLSKQSYVAGWVAVLGSVAYFERRRGLRLAMLAGLPLTLALGGLEWSSGGLALHSMFAYNKLSYSPSQFLGYGLQYFPFVAPELLLMALYVPRTELRRDLRWWLYLAVALVIVVGSGRRGSYFNYFLEFHMALAVLASLGARRTGWLTPLLVLAQLACGLFGTLQPTFPSYYQYARYETLRVFQGRLPTYLRTGWDVSALEPWLAHYPGPILAENVANPLILGYDPWVVDPVIFTCLTEAGYFDERPLVRALEEGRFALVVVQVLEGSPRLSPAVQRAIESHYREAGKAGEERIFIPRY